MIWNYSILFRYEGGRDGTKAGNLSHPLPHHALWACGGGAEPLPTGSEQAYSGAGDGIRCAALFLCQPQAKQNAPGGASGAVCHFLRYNEETLRAALHKKPELLRIGATKSIGDYILLPEIYRYLSRPENELLFLVDNTAHLLAQLEAGELDFVVLEGVFNKERYDSFLLRPEPYIGICSARHPLAGRRASIEELFDQRLILREEGSGTRRILEYELAQQGYRITSFPHRACVSSFKLIKELVRSGYGISFLYEAVVKNDPSFGRFFCPPLTSMHDLNVVVLQNTDAGRLARQFLAR